VFDVYKHDKCPVVSREMKHGKFYGKGAAMMMNGGTVQNRVKSALLRRGLTSIR